MKFSKVFWLGLFALYPLSADAADTYKPTIEILRPTNSQTVNDTVLVHVRAKSGIGISRIELRWDGSNAITTLKPASKTYDYSVTYKWNVNNVPPPGSHSLVAEAFNAAGTSSLTHIMVTVSKSSAPVTCADMVFNFVNRASKPIAPNIWGGNRLGSAGCRTIQPGQWSTCGMPANISYEPYKVVANVQWYNGQSVYVSCETTVQPSNYCPKTPHAVLGVFYDNPLRCTISPL